MKYKIEYDLSRCSKDLIRDFNIDSVLEDDGIEFDNLTEFRSYVEILKDMQRDEDNVELNNILFNIEEIKYRIKDNYTVCVLVLECVDSKYIDEEDEDGVEDRYSILNKYLSDQIDRYNKVPTTYTSSKLNSIMSNKKMW